MLSASCKLLKDMYLYPIYIYIYIFFFFLLHGKPRFQHYPFTHGMGFLCLHQTAMIGSLFILATAVTVSKVGGWLLS